VTMTPNDPYAPAGYQQAGYAPPPPPQAQGTNTMAILALIFAFVFSPLGVIFGFVGRSQIKRTGQKGKGLATAGIVLGLLFIVISIVAAIFIVVLAKNIATTVSKDQVEQQISMQVAAQLGTTPESVTCDNDLPALPGASVKCTMSISGTPTPVVATVTSVENGVANFQITSG
jgi:hypothetical protein